MGLLISTVFSKAHGLDLTSEKRKELFSKLKDDSNISENTTRDVLQNCYEVIIDQPELTPSLDPRIKKAIGIIDQSKLGLIRMNQVARSVCLSPSQFTYLFKKETGLTFREFVIKSKLSRGISALHKNKSVGYASLEGEFSDIAHFSRLFKSAFGIKPSSIK